MELACIAHHADLQFFSGLREMASEQVKFFAI